MEIFHVRYSKEGQLKVQEMAFVLIAVMIFFGIVALIFFKYSFNDLQKKVELQRAVEAAEMLKVLSSTAELEFTSFGDCTNCIDMDKALALKNKKEYKDFWGLEYVQIEVRYPNKTGECDKGNYPNCKTITFGKMNETGDIQSAFVSLCRVDLKIGPYKRCDFGVIYASGLNTKNGK